MAPVRRLVIKCILLTLLVILILWAVLPFFWMVSTSFKTTEETYTVPLVWIPRYPTIKNFLYVVKRAPFLTYFRNSVVVAVSTTVIAIILASLAGYSFSRFKFLGGHSLLLIFLITQMFPGVLLIIPLFQIIKALKLLNTLYALVLSYITFSLPLCTWLMKGFFDQIPQELEEAAMIDGCSRVSAMVRVIFPLALPGVMAASIFSFIGAWDEFIFALIFTSTDKVRTLPVGLQRFITSYEIYWNYLGAASVLTTIPVVILFLFIQRHMVKGLTAGSVKG